MSALPATGPIPLPGTAPLNDAGPTPTAIPVPAPAPLPPVLRAELAEQPRPEPVDLEHPSGRLLLVASTGGHLTELVRLSARWSARLDSVWVTFDTPQSRTVLANRSTEFVPYVAPRDLVGTIRSIGALVRIMRKGEFDLVVSTGAAIAVSAFIAAKLARVPSLYVESVARVSGPSLTGRIVRALRLAATRTQHPRWASRSWRAEESVLTAFATRPRTAVTEGEPRLFVTLGTIQPYRFDALIDAVLATGLADDRTVWQLGATTRDDLPGRVTQQIGHDEFLDVARAADVVITHAGVGTILELLELGVRPVVVAREACRHEHVDDHQAEIARYLASIDVAEVVCPDDLTADQLRLAAGLMTVPAR